MHRFKIWKYEIQSDDPRVIRNAQLLFYGTIVLLALLIFLLLYWQKLSFGDKVEANPNQSNQATATNQLSTKVIEQNARNVDYLETRRDSFESELQRVSTQADIDKHEKERLVTMYRDSIKSLQGQINLWNSKNLRLISQLDSASRVTVLLKTEYEKELALRDSNIKHQESEIESLKRDNQLLSEVRSDVTEVTRKDDARVEAAFKLSNPELLQNTFCDKNGSVKILLRVKDKATGGYITFTESYGEKREYASEIFSLKELSDEVPDKIIFANTQDKPFKKRSEYIFEIYIDGLSRAIGVSAQDLRRTPNVASPEKS